jgi:alpha-L-fucosidase
MQNRRSFLKRGAAAAAVSGAFPGLAGTIIPAYSPTWNSLRNRQTPQWLKDGKFGIYTHWGVYSVPAFGQNGTWYANHVYTVPDSPERKHHEATYGPLDKFGYKGFIPMFTGAKFNADEWADLFQRAGARFAGPVAEHHDGFSMWDTRYSGWNAARMGPKRDIVGELSKAIKARDMKFVTAFHHAENWFYFATWKKGYDSSDARYSGLYGPIHEQYALPDKAFLDRWENKVKEVVDKYGPDFIWFDFGLQLVPDWYKRDLLAYYYNKALEQKKEVVVTYKSHDLPPGAGLLDLELGQEADLTYYEWITDSTMDSGSGWGYVKDLGFKSVDTLVDNLVDRVSKNGYLLLNVGPKPDGTIPEEARDRLLGLGQWLKINGEAIYGTTPWEIAAEGPSRMAAPTSTGVRGFNEGNAPVYTGQDIRFTARDNILYATALDWPGEKVTIKSLAPRGQTWTGLYPSEIASVTMLGDGRELRWEMTKEGLVVETPRAKPCDYAFVFKIVRKTPFRGEAL